MNDSDDRTGFYFDAENEADTDRLGSCLARLLPAGAVVGMIGPLGAGKTRLVRAIAQGCGVQDSEVGSPTFVLIREYHANRTIYHFDAYRLRDEDEFVDIGAEEYFYEDGLSLVEWSDRVENVLPRERMDIVIEITGNDSRRFRFIPYGDLYRILVEELAVQLKAGINGLS